MNLSKLSLSVLGVFALGVSTLASAQTVDSGYGRWQDNSTTRPSSWIPMTSYGYTGLSVGESDFDLGGCAAGLSCDSKDLGFKIFTGGKFNRLLGVELAYVNLGAAEANGGEQKAQGANLSLVGNIPLGERFNIYGKVGGIYGWTKTSATAPGIASGEEDELNWSYGAGVQFDINRNWAVVGDWDHYRFDFASRTDDIELLSAGVVYKF